MPWPISVTTTGTVLLATATPFALSELSDRVLELLLAARRLAGAIGSAVAGRMVAAAAREAYGRREHRKEPDCVTVGVGKAGLGHLLVRFRHGSSGINAHLLNALADRAKRAVALLGGSTRRLEMLLALRTLAAARLE